ncbi:MAG TPA: ribonuclease HII [Chloroflexota bacterium]|nr:ribonuclease HII [Chloroflexota bacterium]
MEPGAPSPPPLDLEYALYAQGCRTIAGVDEVGRGSLAGPLVAAAIILPVDDPTLTQRLGAVRDSKQLSPGQRTEAFRTIREVAVAIGIGWAAHHVVDRRGLTAANRQALESAVRRLSPAPEAVLIDHFTLDGLELPQVSMPKGEARSLSIAAASIVAKVVRDRWMCRCDRRFPSYGFASHKGYGTRLHIDRLRAFGPSPLHRRSFQPVSGVLE